MLRSLFSAKALIATSQQLTSQFKLLCSAVYLGCSFRMIIVIGFLFTHGPFVAAQNSRGRHEINDVQSAEIGRIIQQQIDRGNMAGCVVAIGDHRGITFIKPYGHRQTQPSVEPMTADTLFDLASLTKPIATATSIMKLAEQKKLNIDDLAQQHWPEFGNNGKEKITIGQMLTHQSGLTPDNSIGDYNDGIDAAYKNISQLKLVSPPGTRFSYSDVGFIALAEIVRRTSGQTIDKYSHDHLFSPLKMNDTMFVPDASLRKRAAATEQVDGQMLKGAVHDPRASRLDGVAGHAGLFSTASDLARFARMLLGKGALDGVDVLKPETVLLMGKRKTVSSGFRTLGWDSLSGYSSNRGDLFSPTAFGHGGFTGTSFWVDPELDLFVIFLSNRLHPDGKGSVNTLAGRIGTIAAASRLKTNRQNRSAPHRPDSTVLTGIDVLEQQNFAPLKGLRVGLITNQTGINRLGNRTSALLHQSPNVDLVALFSPEHGLDGKLDVSKILDSNDRSTGLQVFSLYGKNRAPTAEQLESIDILLFDIQDIGTRFYTYIATMGLAMQAAEKRGIPFMVLDRPNPINGRDVQGPRLQPVKMSFVAFHDIPIRHGMTVGELAQMFRAQRQLDHLDLKIVQMKGWHRSDYFDQTGLRWVNPSPNMRNLNQACLYPGIGMLETTNVSVGRGTDTPFEVIGAPWIDERILAGEMNRRGLPGVRFVPIVFQPDSSKFKDQACHGINVIITDRATFLPLATGLNLAHCLAVHFPDQWDSTHYRRLLQNEPVYQEIIMANSKTADDWKQFNSDNREFKQQREEFLLYND